jgi:hypothetical protein
MQRSAGNAAVARFLFPVVAGMEEQVQIPGLVVCRKGTREPILDTEHHWIEIGEESYGWWPSRDPNEGSNADRILLWTGVPGILNGTTLGIGGTATRGTASRRGGSPSSARRPRTAAWSRRRLAGPRQTPCDVLRSA